MCAAVADVVRQDAPDRQQLFPRAQRVDGARDISVGVRQAPRVGQAPAAHRMVSRVPAHLLRRQQAPTDSDYAQPGQ